LLLYLTVSESFKLREEESTFNLCIFIAVAAVNGIGVDALGVQVADGAGLSFLAFIYKKFGIMDKYIIFEI
jgi:hypothetical protein